MTRAHTYPPPHLEPADFPSWSARLRRPYQAGYYAMYSSLFDGIVTDPALMLLPLDDHMAHRGDGVFEAFKCVRGKLYNYAAHWKRLQHSAAAIGLRIPFPAPRVRELVLATIRAGGHYDCSLRLFVSRGPGSFGVNPYDCPGNELYIAVCAPGVPFMQAHPRGAAVGASRYPMKPSAWARLKTCNYLPNVLMKKEAVENGFDFVVAFDEQGHLGEGATENLGLVSADRRLLFPRLEDILAGTTMLRVAELAQSLVGEGLLREVSFEPIPRAALASARELLIVGTTCNVVAVRSFDRTPTAGGAEGPVFQRLAALLEQDMLANDTLLTPVTTADRK